MGVIGELLGEIGRENKTSNLIPLIQLKWEDVEDPLLGILLNNIYNTALLCYQKYLSLYLYPCGLLGKN